MLGSGDRSQARQQHHCRRRNCPGRRARALGHVRFHMGPEMTTFAQELLRQKLEDDDQAKCANCLWRGFLQGALAKCMHPEHIIHAATFERAWTTDLTVCSRWEPKNRDET